MPGGIAAHQDVIQGRHGTGAAGEGRGQELDPADLAVAAHGAALDVATREAHQQRGEGLRRRRPGRGLMVEQRAAAREGRPPDAVGKEAEVSNADKAFGDDVQEEAPQTLVGGEVQPWRMNLKCRCAAPSRALPA